MFAPTRTAHAQVPVVHPGRRRAGGALEPRGISRVVFAAAQLGSVVTLSALALLGVAVAVAVAITELPNGNGNGNPTITVTYHPDR